MATASDGDATFHAVQRRLAALLPDEHWVEAPAPLELAAVAVQETPRLVAAQVVEGKALRAIDVDGAPESHFAAFLDGTQTSKVVRHVDGVPIVHGSVAAVVRARSSRRLHTWHMPRVERRLYAPMRLLSAEWRARLDAAGIQVTDPFDQRELESPHPFAMQDEAIHAVQRDREALERELAERWCRDGDGVLCLDGSMPASDLVARSSIVVAVVKSHRTLYVGADALQHVLRLERGQRSSVVRITAQRRPAVASWYLRLRDARGRDPMWGLVRVEVAEPDASATRAIAVRANEVSRWILGEALPLSVPDARWDKMVYGVRDCEEFLRAIA